MKILSSFCLFALFAAVSYVTTHDDPFDRIIGGDDAKPGEFPWQVSLRKYGRHICGATIISERWVLTAAHCPEGFSTMQMTVVCGRLSKDEKEPNEQIVEVEKIFQNKEFDEKTYENDIALLKLAQPLVFNDYVKPLRLPSVDYEEPSEPCTVTGWGYITPDGGYPKLLQKVSLPLITDEQCRILFIENYVADHMFCAWGKDKKDACNGDSGGPMTCNDKDGKPYLAGITSWGLGCALLQYPGVYTQVSYFLTWIEDIKSAN